MTKTQSKADTEVVLPPSTENETGAVSVATTRRGALPANRDSSGDGYVLFGLVAGAVVGAVVGLFLAPRRGAETREQLTRPLREEEAREQLLGKVLHGTAAPVAAPGILDPIAQLAQYQTPPMHETAPALASVATGPAVSTAP